MNRRTTPGKSTGSGNGMVWIIFIGIAVTIIASVSKCSPGTSTRTAAEIATSNPTIKSLNSAVAAQTIPAIQPLNAAGIATGISNMRTSIAAEGFSGAMIYSQNCYDALSHNFGWRLLDICGAADLKAVASMPEYETSGASKESAYFQSEVAAARYLGAATGAGAPAAEADERFAAMQSRVSPAKPKIDDRDDDGNAAATWPAQSEPANTGAIADAPARVG